jgi:hypothetical protein
VKETANRGKGPICSCGIGELSLPEAEGQTGPLKSDADPKDEGAASKPAPDREDTPVEEARHKP